MAAPAHPIRPAGAPPLAPDAAPPIALPQFMVILFVCLICLSLGMLALFRVDWRPLIEGKSDLWSVIGAADAFLHNRPIYDASNSCVDSACFPFPFAYLPGSLLPFIPLVGLNPYLAFALFTAFSIGVFVTGVAALLRARGCSWRRALVVAPGALLLFPAIDNILWGQSQLLLTGLIALSLAVPPIAGGILIGLAGYYKLYPALLIGAFLLAGDRRRGLAGLATLAALGLASLAFFGLALHLEFLHFLSRLVVFFSAPSYHIANYSLRGLLVFQGFSAEAAGGATLLVALGWAAGAWRLRGDRELCYAFTLGASALISPIVWRNYFLLGVPIAILLYDRALARGRAARAIYAAGVVAMLTAGLNLFVPAIATAPLPLLGTIALCGLCLLPVSSAPAAPGRML